MVQRTRHARALPPGLLRRRRIARRALLTFLTLASIAATCGIVVRPSVAEQHPTDNVPASVPGTPAPTNGPTPLGTPAPPKPTAQLGVKTPVDPDPPVSLPATTEPRPTSPSTRPAASSPRPSPKPPAAPATGPTAPYDPDDH